VQLQSVSESPGPASEAAADTSSAAPSASSAPPAAGAKPPDLDELARRLYEPLTARLRAELWLDRERAGVMSDA
jgi:3-oxoacyl-ACP reductase-like protein